MLISIPKTLQHFAKFMLETRLPSDDSNFWHELDWRVPHPFILSWTITEQDIDHYGHANNASYVRQMEKLSWAHSSSLGLGIDEYRELDRAMVIKSHSIEYLSACHLDDQIATATWIHSSDNKLRLQRGFQFIHLRTHKTVLEARTDYVCVTLSKGKPAKMPDSFVQSYGNVVQQLLESE